tara:strand:- start:119 stop:235 length:117 start_codon:yes stop_codon:yes gene_type:complete
VQEVQPVELHFAELEQEVGRLVKWLLVLLVQQVQEALD